MSEKNHSLELKNFISPKVQSIKDENQHVFY